MKPKKKIPIRGLALNRRPEQQILIGTDIVVSVLDVRAGGNVLLAIDAPDDVCILRAEVLRESDYDRDAIMKRRTKDGNQC